MDQKDLSASQCISEHQSRWRDEAMMKEEMKEKKMRTMYFQNLEMKEYVKKGTLYEARKTWT